MLKKGVVSHSSNPQAQMVIHRTSLLLALFFTPLSFLTAAALTWDGNTGSAGVQDGAGTWNTSALDVWYNNDSIPAGYQAWSNATPDTAIFGVGTGSAGTVTLGEAITAGGLTFNATGSGTYTLSGNTLTLAGTPLVTANVDATISSALAGNAGLTKSGIGNLTLSGSSANTLTGSILISAGTLTINKTSGVNALAGNIEVATGGTLAWSSGHNQIADSSSITVSGGAINFNGRSETFANFTQTSGGQTGGNAGLIEITGTLAMSGGTLLTINSNGRWSANAVDFTGYSTAGNVLLMGGDGNSFITSFTVGSGGLFLSGQTLMLNRTTTADRLGNELILNGNVTASGTNSITYNSSSAALTTGAVNQVNLGAATRTWNITADTTTVNLAIVGDGGLTKTGNGTLTLAGVDSNSYTGLTTVSAGFLLMSKTTTQNAVGGDILVNGGTLEWTVSDQVPDTATITVSSGPTLDFNGRNETFANYIQTGGIGMSASSANSGIVNITGTATLSGGSAMTVNSGGQMTVNKFEALGYSGTVINVGGNSSARITTLTIGAGGMTLSGQTITLNKATSASNMGSELILNGDFTGTGTNNINIPSGTFGVAQINVGTEQRSFTINSGTTNLNVPVIGSGGILKTGIGSLRLSAENTYTGKTTVSDGDLTLTSTGNIAESSWLQIDSGATFDVSAVSGGFTYAPASGTRVISGGGTVTGSLNVGGTAQIRPGSTSNAADISTAGDGYGTLAISGNLAFDPPLPSTVASFNILDGGTADQITIGGDLTLTANSLFEITFDEDYIPTLGDYWVLLDWDGLLNATGFSLGDNNRTGSDLAANEGNINLPDLTTWGLLWDISPMTNNGSLTVAITPEPGRLCLIGVGLLSLGLRRRRRSSVFSPCS